MLPYGIYSVFHVATYTRANLIPTAFPPKKLPASAASPNQKAQYAPHPLGEAIGNFVKQYYDVSMSMVSALEILLWIRLLLAAVFFQRRSWILLAVYTAFLRTRFSNSSHVQNSFAQLEARVDDLVGAQGTLPLPARPGTASRRRPAVPRCDRRGSLRQRSRGAQEDLLNLPSTRPLSRCQCAKKSS